MTPALRGAGLPILAVLCALALGALAPGRAAASDVSRGGAWLVSVQNGDGGFGASPGSSSGPEMTCWAMLGLEAAGRNPLDVSRGNRTPVDFLRANLGQVTSAGDLARTILALQGAGVDPRGFGGQNLISKLLGRRLKNGSFENWPNTTAYAAIALRTAGASGGLDRTLEWLRGVQNEDGGWGDTPGAPSNADGTGAVLQALGRGSKASRAGLAYLEKVQVKGGGFALGGNGAINTQSTALAIQGILAAGADPDSFRRGGAGAPEFLAQHQESDGHARYSSGSDQTPVWVTGQDLVAAAGEYYPISPPARKPKPKPPSQASSTGGVHPSSANPSPRSGPVAAPPSRSSVGGGGLSAGHVAPSGQSSHGTEPARRSSRGRVRQGSAAPDPGEPAVSSGPGQSAAAAESGDGSSGLGAIVAGLAVGCLLFGAAWAGRRIWMRRRYGI